MPRLFTALEIPPAVRRELSLARGGLPGARWIDEENYHLTLRFIGDVDGRQARDIMIELERVRRRPVNVKLEYLAAFGGDRPRTLVARAKADGDLLELQADHERVLRRTGLAPEKRKFVPHVTLARLRSSTSTDVAGYLGMRGVFPAQTFQAEHFVLFSSRASTGGGPYLQEAQYSLTGGIPVLRED